MRIPRVLGRWGTVACFCLIVLSACSQSPHRFHLLDVTGHQPDLALFHAPTAKGGTLTAQDLRGKVVVLFFGYTHCPNVCPTTLAKLQAVTQRLDGEADKLRVLFVSVDPKRDTPALLERFVDSFNPKFIALRPDAELLPKLTSRYHFAYSYGKPDASGNYTVNHTSKFLVFDQKGRMRLMGSYNDPIDAIAGDLAYLVKHTS